MRGGESQTNIYVPNLHGDFSYVMHLIAFGLVPIFNRSVNIEIPGPSVRARVSTQFKRRLLAWSNIIGECIICEDKSRILSLALF